jgi:hypothetical protein
VQRGAIHSTQEVYKGKRGEMRKKVLITNYSQGKPSGNPRVKSKKKVMKNFLKRPQRVFKASSITFLQIHHIRHRGIIFQATTLLERPAVHQHANNSLTKPGIIQHNPNRLKIAFHKAFATLQ